MPKFDVGDLISATELARNTASLLKKASEGSRLLIINKNTPVAALIGMEDLRRLDALNAAAADAGAGAGATPPSAPQRPTFDDFRRALHSEIGRPNRVRDQTTLSVPLGTTHDGQPYWIKIDDSQDAPHTLIVGATGTGASTALHVVAWGLCVRYRPERVNLILAGRVASSWTTLHELKHIVHVTHNDTENGKTDLDHVLDAEISRRSDHTREHGEHNPLPSLIIMLDGPDQPEWQNLLDKITAAGPGLGIHVMVTAPQPPARKRHQPFAYRVALKMRSAASTEFIGSNAAAMLSAPGSAIVADGTTEHEIAIYAPYTEEGQPATYANLNRSDFTAPNKITTATPPTE